MDKSEKENMMQHPSRKRLPNRRHTHLSDMEFRGQMFTVAFSSYENEWAPAEVFIDAHKSGNHVSSDARDIAVLLSIAMQYGVPLKAMAEAVCRVENGEAAGLAGAVLDFLIKERAEP